jgi:hypothetical protein
MRPEEKNSKALTHTPSMTRKKSGVELEMKAKKKKKSFSHHRIRKKILSLKNRREKRFSPKPGRRRGEKEAKRHFSEQVILLFGSFLRLLATLSAPIHPTGRAPSEASDLGSMLGPSARWI